MKNIIKKILERKILVIIIALVIIIGGYYGYRSLYGNKSTTSYITAVATKGMLLISVSGSGQVLSLNQIDIKPKVSGQVTYVSAKEGQEVKGGTTLFKLDTADAEKSVRDAEVNLESAKLALAKLVEPADTLSILQAENSLAQANESKQKTNDDLTKSYEDGFNTTASAFLDLPTIMNGLQDILFGYDTTLGGSNQWNIFYYTNEVSGYDSRILKYGDDAIAKYQEARKEYDNNFSDYKAASRESNNATIEFLVNETYNTTEVIADAVKSANNAIQFYKDKTTERGYISKAIASSHIAALNIYTGQTNSHLTNLLNIRQSIQDDKIAIVNAERSIAEKTETFNKLKNGPSDLDIQSQKLSVKQRENSLLDAKEKLADYSIRAPFDGIVTKIIAKVGDQVSSSAIATLVTHQKIAEISLNEVDVAKIKDGQKVTLTFDAVPDLSITGGVAQIDTIGTITQGVVTYNVKIGFDTQDERVKSGMSVSAAIIIDIKQDVILAPNAAVKSGDNGNYVQILVDGVSQNQTVEVGLSNDTMAEIISGIKEGDKVVTQTVTLNATTSASTTQSTGLRIPGITGGGR